MSIQHPISDKVCAFQYNEIGHFCLYPSISWGFPLNTEFRITSIKSHLNVNVISMLFCFSQIPGCCRVLGGHLEGTGTGDPGFNNFFLILNNLFLFGIYNLNCGHVITRRIPFIYSL